MRSRDLHRLAEHLVVATLRDRASRVPSIEDDAIAALMYKQTVHNHVYSNSIGSDAKDTTQLFES